MQQPFRKSASFGSGFTIIEVIVAMVVLGAGAMGIAMLNSKLLQTTGDSKSRAEATQLAQDRIEAARDFILEAGCADTNLAATALTTTHTGVNAEFSITRTVSSTTNTDPWRQISVCVTWNGGTCQGADNRVLLNSTLHCAGTGLTARASGVANQGDFIKTPSGRAQVGGIADSGDVGEGVVNLIEMDGRSLFDGTRTVLREDGNLVLLDDTTNEVLLTVSRYACEDEAPALSTITGKVFIDAKNGDPIAADPYLFVLSSDASYCARLPYNPDWVMPEGATGNAIEYFYTYYQCYVGAEWWGNIGVIRTDNANTNDRVCVGNPLSANIGNLFSKHAQRSTNRAYRGYREMADGRYETQGIGEDSQVLSTCSVGNRTTYLYTPHHYRNHHFLHANITGQSSCQTKAADLNALTPLYALGQHDTIPTVDSDAIEGELVIAANNNPGRYYCMSHLDGVSCIDLTDDEIARETRIHGRITRHDDAALSAIDGLENACKPETESLVLTADGTAYNYVCDINWVGYPAPSWQGTLSFAALDDATLCGGLDASISITPVGEPVAYTVNDLSHDEFPNSLQFDAVPMAVTDIELNMAVRAGNCGIGPQSVPLPVWVGATDPQHLSWSSVTGATEYKIYQCQGADDNALSVCTPTNLVSTQTSRYYYPATVGNRQTFCYTVVATDGTIDTEASQRRCIHAHGNSWSYQ